MKEDMALLRMGVPLIGCRIHIFLFVRLAEELTAVCMHPTIARAPQDRY